MKKHSQEWIWRIKILLTVILCMGIAAWQNIEVYGNSEENQKQQETEEEGAGDAKNLSQDETEITEELLEEVDLSDVQKMLDELFGKDSFSMKEALIKLTSRKTAYPFFYESNYPCDTQTAKLFQTGETKNNCRKRRKSLCPARTATSSTSPRPRPR